MKTEKSFKYGVNLSGWNAFYEEYGDTPLQFWINRLVRKGKK